MKEKRSEKECRHVIDKIHKESPEGQLAISYVRSRYDTDYMSDITELWLIESYLAGYRIANDQNSIANMFDQIPTEKNARALHKLFIEKIAERKIINSEFKKRIDAKSPNADFLDGESRGIDCELKYIEMWLKQL